MSLTLFQSQTNQRNLELWTGENAPYISFLLVTLYIGGVSFSIEKPLVYFFLFFLLSSLLNVVLKLWIKEPRPFGPKQYRYSSSGIILPISLDKQISSYNQYGMPSGHAQTMAFLTMYSYLQTHSVFLLILNLLLTYSTAQQRVIANRHTENQVNWGLFVGSLFALVCSLIVKRKI